MYTHGLVPFILVLTQHTQVLDAGAGRPAASVEAIDMHLNMLRSAVAGMGGAVQVASVGGGVAVLQYKGPPALAKGVTAAVKVRPASFASFAAALACVLLCAMHAHTRTCTPAAHLVLCSPDLGVVCPCALAPHPSTGPPNLLLLCLPFFGRLAVAVRMPSLTLRRWS